MLATNWNDTWNVLNMQHITLNSERWDYQNHCFDKCWLYVHWTIIFNKWAMMVIEWDSELQNIVHKMYQNLNPSIDK